MSVDVKDFRRLRAVEAGETTLERPTQPLLQQVEVSVDMQTGDENLDKLIRTLAASMAGYEKQSSEAAVKCAGAVQEHMVRLCQFEFMYLRGKIDGLKEASNVPLHIMNEKRMIS